MKITIIGVGAVGGTVAASVLNSNLASEMVLIDIDKLRVNAVAEDLNHAASFGFGTKIIGTTDYKNIRGSEIVIITAGANQKPDQTRTDLQSVNAKIMSTIVRDVMRVVDKKIVKLIIISNPLDTMVMLAQKISKLPTERVIGTGTMLDTARFRAMLARELDVSPRSIHASVLGEHGDSSIANWSGITIGNLDIESFSKQIKNPITKSERKQIEEKVRRSAYEIIMGRGATWDGIGAAATDLIRCIVKDERRIVHVSIVGKDGVAYSVPRIVGRMGVIHTLTPKLNADESAALKKSIKTIKENFAKLK